MKEWFIIWFKAARAPFLVISFLPALLGGAIAAAYGPIPMGILYRLGRRGCDGSFRGRFH